MSEIAIEFDQTIAINGPQDQSTFPERSRVFARASDDMQ